jgi:DNA-binding beta-propeller fold protein YncE
MVEKRFRVIVIFLLIIVIALTYLYFYLTPKGEGGIKEITPAQVEGVQFLFAVVGPGRRSSLPYLWRPLGVGTDKKGNIYISDTNNHRICVFDSQGRFLFEFGSYGIDRPHAPQEKPWQGGQFNKPYGIAVADNGQIYVADMANGRVQVFSPRGKFLFYFPQKKSLNPKSPAHAVMLRPRDLTIFQDKVYICDSFRIAIFDLDGNYLGSLGSRKVGSRPGDLYAPNGVVVSEDGTVYVADSNNFRVQAFKPNGEVKWVLGGASSGEKIGVPRGLAIDRKGNLLVLDAILSKILVISPQGKIIAKIGQRGGGNAQFNFPNDIAVRPDGVIYIADKDNNRIQAVRIKY